MKSYVYGIDSTTVSNFLNARDCFGQTGFYYACIYGCKNIVEVILNNSEDVALDLGDQYGSYHSLQFASWVKLLINNFELSKHWYCNMFNQGFEMREIFQHLVWLFQTPWCYQACLFLQNNSNQDC